MDWGLVDWGLVDWGLVDWGLVDWGLVDWGLVGPRPPPAAVFSDAAEGGRGPKEQERNRLAIPFEQRAGDVRPLGFETDRGGRHGPARFRVPITRIGPVALFAVQVGMNPGSVAAFVLLCPRVRLVPVATRIMPQRFQRLAQGRGRTRVVSHGSA